MDIHHLNHRIIGIIRIIANKHGFKVDPTAPDADAKIVMELVGLLTSMVLKSMVLKSYPEKCVKSID
jgi:hypothetical protein